MWAGEVVYSSQFFHLFLHISAHHECVTKASLVTKLSQRMIYDVH